MSKTNIHIQPGHNSKNPQVAGFYSDIHIFYFHVLAILTIFPTYINSLLERMKEFRGVNGVNNFGGK